MDVVQSTGGRSQAGRIQEDCSFCSRNKKRCHLCAASRCDTRQSGVESEGLAVYGIVRARSNCPCHCGIDSVERGGSGFGFG
eukprot:scaffold148953_cov33-Tisochrysis_lutea.AAC.4